MSILQSPLARKLSAFVALSAPDLDILTRFHRSRKTFAPGHEMVTAGQAKQTAFILAEGWACS